MTTLPALASGLKPWYSASMGTPNVPSPKDNTALPRHVGIIMDGNGRWAAERGLPRIEGHRAGAESVRDVVRAAREMGVEALTLYAFSEQNWDRPVDEVQALMELLQRYVLEERDEIMDNDIRLTAIGLVDHLPIFVRQPLFDLIEESSKNKQMWLCLALSYGGREDIVSAVKSLVSEVVAGDLVTKDIDEEAIASRLSTSMLPPLDLVIRSSGEQRLSNFLLWEAAYAEFLFSETMWPDFRREHLREALETYQSRERRFGRTSAQIASQ